MSHFLDYWNHFLYFTIWADAITYNLDRFAQSLKNKFSLCDRSTGDQCDRWRRSHVMEHCVFQKLLAAGSDSNRTGSITRLCSIQKIQAWDSSEYEWGFPFIPECSYESCHWVPQTKHSSCHNIAQSKQGCSNKRANVMLAILFIKMSVIIARIEKAFFFPGSYFLFTSSLKPIIKCIAF